MKVGADYDQRGKASRKLETRGGSWFICKSEAHNGGIGEGGRWGACFRPSAKHSHDVF